MVHQQALLTRLEFAGRFGFVEMRTEELASSAMAMDKVDLCGRAINVGRPKGYVEPPQVCAQTTPASGQQAFSMSLVIVHRVNMPAGNTGLTCQRCSASKAQVECLWCTGCSRILTAGLADLGYVADKHTLLLCNVLLLWDLAGSPSIAGCVMTSMCCLQGHAPPAQLASAQLFAAKLGTGPQRVVMLKGMTRAITLFNQKDQDEVRCPTHQLHACAPSKLPARPI